MILIALSMLLFYSLGQDNQTEVQYDFYGHVTPLAPAWASRDTDSIVNDTFLFFRSRQSK